MPFIGKLPDVGAFRLIDSITTSATDTYALQVEGLSYFPSSARNLIVSLNGVTQAPETAYTVSGSHIVFASALTASDVIDYILVLGDVLDIGTPSDGTVGTSQMNYPLDNFSSTGIDDNATSTAITIDASENVGIGAASPSSYYADKLVASVADESGITISCNSAHKAYLMFADGTTGSDAYRGWLGYDHALDELSLSSHDYIKFQSGGTITERMRIDSSGNLLVGTTNVANSATVPGHYILPSGLHTSTRDGGVIRILNRLTSDGDLMIFRKDGTTVGAIGTSGSSTYYNTSSDYRLKENIVDAPAGNIDAVRVRSFDWKADGSHQTYGMVAQELVDVAPEAVSQGETEDDMWGVDYSKLVPMMIKEIQDLKAEVAALKGA